MKILMIVLILALGTSRTLFSAEDYIAGEGRFYSDDKDSLKFVKRQLLNSAFRDVLSKELKNLGLDEGSFWQKYDEKFLDFFTPIEEQLKVKYGLDKSDTSISSQSQKNFQEELRKKRLLLKSKFGEISRVVESYKIISMSRSASVPQSRYMKIMAKVNIRALKSFYYRFSRTESGPLYYKLYISTDFHLRDLEWKDLGVSHEEELSSVIKEHWRRWFFEKLQGQVSEIEVLNRDKEEDFSKTLLELQGKKKEPKEGESPEVTKIEDVESLWLRVDFTISKVWEDSLLNEKTLRFKGEFLLLELGRNRPIGHGDIDELEKKFIVQEEESMSSRMASTLYNMPLYLFKNFPQQLDAVPKGIQKETLWIQNISSITDLTDMIDVLQNKGTGIEVTASIELLENQTGKVAIFYKGNKENLLDLFQKLDQAEVNKRKITFKADEQKMEYSFLTNKDVPSEEL